MRKSKQFPGLPVVSLAEGRQIGTVKDLVINPAARAVAALIIETGAWRKEQRFIPYQRIHSVGDDAITIHRSSNVEKGTSLPEIMQLLKERVTLTGSRLLTPGGQVLGRVEEYYVDVKTGQIVGLEISGGQLGGLLKGRAFLDSNLVETIGPRLIICREEARENMIKIDGGLAENLQQWRERGDRLWESTRQASSRLGSSLEKSLEKARRLYPQRKAQTGQAESNSPENTCHCPACAQPDAAHRQSPATPHPLEPETINAVEEATVAKEPSPAPDQAIKADIAPVTTTHTGPDKPPSPNNIDTKPAP
ncbi:PRC-barrel domain-containing protein [Desulfurispora thermophila]|uniref:PRC-barrel domain-containing protein n=1 Tax=Desulfurispora thermophila TaxID=265470 RepID=UPI00037731A9|nr:PRC-barrel domain-containing protein [Desulfurispora thermophila]